MGPSSNKNVLRVNFLQTKPFSMGPCRKARVTKVREKSGKVRFYSGKTCFFLSDQGISKSLFKVSEKSGNFILRLPQSILLDFFL